MDTRLRTAIKSQLDGIKTGLTQLDAAVKDMQKVLLRRLIAFNEVDLVFSFIHLRRLPFCL